MNSSKVHSLFYLQRAVETETEEDTEDEIIERRDVSSSEPESDTDQDNHDDLDFHYASMEESTEESNADEGDNTEDEIR